ncbi:MAG: hypothetical protein L3K18_05545 [Thermoplasmata archaeon]|nr:hypothetical protein [Thermoplasmata archaeon]MCI4356590.1 hypothetical protein [Thermoplasmata archaeon]
MHRATLLVGLLVVFAGVVLIATHGVVLGINIPQAVGLPCSGGGNQTFCPGFASFSVGGVVLLAGLPMVLRGLTAPDPAAMMQRGMMGGGFPPEILAQMMAAQRAQAPVASTSTPASTAPVRYCPACGQSNIAAAAFCNRCGKPMPPAT